MLNKIISFLLSLTGKGWLWGFYSGDRVNNAYDEMKFINTGTDNPDLEASRKSLNEEIDRWVDEKEHHDKEELTEIDFMCAWLMVFGLLPDESNIIFQKNREDNYYCVETDNEKNFFHRVHSRTIFFIRKDGGDNYRWSMYKEEFKVISTFILTHGIENLEWMFKSVKYDT